MADIAGNPIFVEPETITYVAYWWGPPPHNPAFADNKGQRYAGGHANWPNSLVYTYDQRMRVYQEGYFSGKGYEYGVTIRNDGPNLTYVSLYTIQL